MQLLKTPRFLSATIGTAFFLSLIAGAPLAQAASLNADQISAITNLLQAFGADPATVANVQAVLEGHTPSTSSTSSTSAPSNSGSSEGAVQSTSNGNVCNVLSGNLQFGSSGKDVSLLQKFLGSDKSVYPEDLVTGYFGSSTLTAVQKWQTDHGIVATGTPDSTGYGFVGPHTRSEMDKEMEMECENGGLNHSSDAVTASSTSAGESGSSSGDQTASSTTGDN
ncbi:MAG TPA: peptidoglycan-binding domain-containing protein [Candidatus Paceibacterota bacterium]|nr:peptidoglycan-binding domain-containing protein [Candidatus Paceibacterota bacterium]